MTGKMAGGGRSGDGSLEVRWILGRHFDLSGELSHFRNPRYWASEAGLALTFRFGSGAGGLPMEGKFPPDSWRSLMEVRDGRCEHRPVPEFRVLVRTSSQKGSHARSASHGATGPDDNGSAVLTGENVRPPGVLAFHTGGAAAVRAAVPCGGD